jgi:heat shock protein HtpX
MPAPRAYTWRAFVFIYFVGGVFVFKRIGLLIATNLAIMLVLSVVMNVLEAAGVFGTEGLWRSYGPMMVMAAIVGFGGAFLSLAISKMVAKWTTGARVIENPSNATERWLVETVRRQAERVGIAMPEVAIYEGPEMNAFATGPSRNNSLVAVSTGLLQSMERDEVEAVLGHEVAHVANGDMVTMTLLQGVLNTFVIFLARIIGGLVDSMMRGRDDREGPGIGYWIAVNVAQIALGIGASFIVAWFSRRREYRADEGGADLVGTSSMVNALRRLGRNEESTLPQSVQAFGISGKGGFLALMSSHPPIEERIRVLQERQQGKLVR